MGIGESRMRSGGIQNRSLPPLLPGSTRGYRRGHGDLIVALTDLIANLSSTRAPIQLSSTSTVAKCDTSAEASGQHPENPCPDAWIVSWNQLDQNVQLRSSRVSDTISGEFSNDETPKTPKLESHHLPPLRIRPRGPPKCAISWGGCGSGTRATKALKA